ncbi:MAG: hypothetical protein Q8L04_03785, partial [Ignavibacteria bacterium]|nr:hypothetical protein [Ignavibacteria bacterium]
MIEEEFEMKLREKINNVLETEQEDFTQEHWDNFEKKLIYAQNKKRFNSYLRIAATILLFTLTGVSLYIYDKYYTNTNQIASHDNSQQRKT